MLQKQNMPSDYNKPMENFFVEPQVQIKEELKSVQVPFNETALVIEKPSNEIEIPDIKFEIEEDLSSDEIENDSVVNDECEKSLTSDLVKKINEDTNEYVRMRWSSLVNRVMNFRDSSIEEGTYKSDLTCKKCCLNFILESDLINHVKNHNVGYKCFECDQVFDRPLSLKIHGALHRKKKRRHKCNICQKCFTRKSSLNEHSLSHSGKKPYQCNVCKKYYRSRVSLASHARYHYKDKKYECPVCKKLFFQPSGVSEHLRMHKNDKDYKCDICNKHFSYRSTLRRHVKSHFETEKYACDECDKYFKQSSSLLFHKRSKHLGLKPYKCEDCHKTFTRSRSLKLHMNSHRDLQIQNTIEIISRRR